MKYKKSNINLSYPLDRNCVTCSTNTLNGLLNKITTNKFTRFILLFVSSILLFIITINVFIKKTTMDVPAILMVAIKRLMVVASILLFITSILLFIASILLFMKKRSMVNTKRLMDYLTINVFIAKSSNSYTTFIKHISNLKGYNRYAEWFRPKGYNVTSGLHLIARNL